MTSKATTRFLLVILLPIVPACAQQMVGYVLEMDGEWTIAGTTPAKALSKGGQLPGAGLVENNSPADGNFIVIANLNGDVIKRIKCRAKACYECRDSGTCYDRVQRLPAAKPQTGFLAASFAVIMDLFGSGPDRFSVHRVRALGLGRLDDGVVQLVNEQVDLGPILHSDDRGRYYLRFETLADSSQPSWRSGAIVADWDPALPTRVSIDGLQHGLYLVSLLVPRGKSFSNTGVDAWVLVAGRAGYEKVSQKFKEVEEQMKRWGDEVSVESRAGYLRAYLEILSNQISK